jgi:hypothetical protein
MIDLVVRRAGEQLGGYVRPRAESASAAMRSMPISTWQPGVLYSCSCHRTVSPETLAK